VKIIFRLYLALAAIFFLSLPALGQEKVMYNWERTSNSLSLVKMLDGRETGKVWQFNFPEGKRSYFHPVYSPDGTLLTAAAPPDHRWHLGLWFCWKYINGLNYWEYSGDPKYEISEGKTDMEEISIRTRRNGAAVIKMSISYHPWDSAHSVVLKEQRTMVMDAPDQDGSYTIEFLQEFQAVKDIKLERTPPQTSPNGVSWGGYAGLSVRFDQSLKDPVYFSTELDSMASGKRTPWVAASLVNQNGKRVQMVIAEDPDNIRYPTPWYCINRPAEKFWYYNAALLYHEGLSLKAGETFRLRYKILFPAEPLTKAQVVKSIF
jgi:hypothetical protein